MEKMMSAAPAELRARCDDEATSKPELHPPHQGNNAKQNKDGRRQITDDKLDTAQWLRTAFTPGKSSADNGLAVFVLCPEEEEERKAFGDFLFFSRTMSHFLEGSYPRVS